MNMSAQAAAERRLELALETIAALRTRLEAAERVVEAAKRLYHGHPQETAEEYNSAWNGLRDALIALDAGKEGV